jgi:hypothetical protein
MYSIINVNNGNRIERRMLVSFPIVVVCRMKNMIRARVTACKIPNIQKMLFFIFLLTDPKI